MDPLLNRKWSLNNLTLKIFWDKDKRKMGNWIGLMKFSNISSGILYQDTSLRCWCLNGQSPPNSLFRPQWSPNVLWNAQSDPELHAWFNNGRGTARDSNPFSLVDFLQQAHHAPFLHRPSHLIGSNNCISGALNLNNCTLPTNLLCAQIQYEVIAILHQQMARQSLLIKFVCICAKQLGFKCNTLKHHSWI